jgi:hypothetical protein
MRADFVITSLAMLVWWVLLTAAAFAWYGGVVGTVNMFATALAAALALWVQWCVRAGECVVLGWIIAAAAVLQLVLVIVAVALIDAKRRRDRRHGGRSDDRAPLAI